MPYLIAGSIFIVLALAFTVVMVLDHRQKRRKITVFINGELVRPRDYVMGPDGIPVFSFTVQTTGPVENRDSVQLVRGNGTSEILNADKIRTATGATIRRVTASPTPLNDGVVTRQEMDRRFEALRGSFDDHPVMPPMPAMPAMPSIERMVRPGVVIRHENVRTVTTSREPAQAPATPRFERDLDIPE